MKKKSQSQCSIKYIVLLFVFLALYFVPLYSQHRTKFIDDVLVTIPQMKMKQVEFLIPAAVHLYQRFSDVYVAGMKQQTVLTLQRKNIPVRIIDEHPWREQYAVVTAFSTPPHIRAEDIVNVLFRSGDMLFVKGSPRALENLRCAGFSFAEIEEKEIPLVATKTYFPQHFSIQKSNIIDTIISFVSDTSIRNYIQQMQNFGTRHWNQPNRDSVFRWVKNKFLVAGITDVQYDSFSYNSTWQKNVIATLPGTNEPSGEIIVGGHLDSYSSNLQQAPGADDNASGTAAALEMARVLKLVNYQPSFTLRFIGFAAEEAGLVGSADYAAKADAQNRDIRAMLNYDMIANRTQSQPDRDYLQVWYEGAKSFSDVHAKIATTYTTLTPVFTTQYRSGSDSWSFYQHGYPSTFCIERDFSPYYHSPNDKLQYLDMQYAKDIVKSGLATLLTLDMLPPNVRNLSARDRGNGTSIFVSWDSVPVPDWSTYKIYLGTAPGNYDTNFTTTSRAKLIMALVPHMQYFIGVSIVDLIGREGMISEISATPHTVPNTPTGITATPILWSIILSWNTNREMDMHSYKLYRAVSPSTAFALYSTLPFTDTMFVEDDTISAGLYSYFVTAVDSAGNESATSDTVSASPITNVREVNEHNPTEITLMQNYPNPFNPTTTIRFEIPPSPFAKGETGGLVSLKVYNILGQEVATLIDNAKLEAGKHTIPFDASALTSGVYVYQLTTQKKTLMRKMLLMK